MPEEEKTEIQPIKDTITFDEFQRVDLRTAKVITAERIPKTDKLLKLEIEVGSEQRQLVAGVAEHYEPETLEGKTIIIVANLQPVKIRGVESQGMLLAAESDGKLVLVTTDEEITSGAKVK